MRISLVALGLAALLPAHAASQAPDFRGALRWRTIGPFRAGRARALAGVPGKPTVFYIGFDNGGVWRSSDYGSNWEPLFDREATGSIGAIAVAPSSTNIIYVGTGAGIIRPDLATGNGIYRSNDTGRTWTPPIPTGCSWRPSAIRTVPTQRGAFIAPPTAAARSSRCSTRTSTPAG